MFHYEKTKTSKALIAMILAVILVASPLMPMAAFAEENSGLSPVNLTVEFEWLGVPDDVEKPDTLIELVRKAPGEEKYVFVAEDRLTGGILNHTFIDNDPGDPAYSYDIRLMNYDEFKDDYTFSIIPQGQGFKITFTYAVKQKVDLVGDLQWTGGKPFDQVGFVKPGNTSVQLYRNGQPLTSKIVYPADMNETDSGWTADVSFGEYDRFDANNNPYLYTIDSGTAPRYEKNASGMSILYNLKSVPKTITVTKTWIGGPDVKPAATINIQMRQSSIYKEDFPVVFDNPSFVGLVNGLETWRETKSVVVETNRFSSFSATAKEVPVPKYRTAKIGGNWVTGFTVTNIFQNNVTATKTWVGGPDPKPTVVLRLNRQAGTDRILKGYQRTLQPGNEVALWEGVGTEVANDAGVPYKYWVEELTVLNDYEKLEEGLSVTNTYVSPKTTIVEGKKDWVDGEKVRPESVTLILMRNGVEHTTQEGITSRVPVGKDEDWTHTWSGLVDNDSTGTPYEYSVDEVDVEDFVKTFRGNTVVNTYSSPTNTEVEAKKIWVDGEHLRPRTITLILKRNGIESDRVKVGAKQKWTHKWSGLEDNDSTGTPYTYSVDEIEVRNFEKSITGNVITNTYHSPKKMIVAAKKIWVDGENLRPEKVTLILKRNGIKIKEIEVGADEHWSHIWSGLENTNSKGLPYIYTVDEVAVPGFKKIVVGPIVTNFYVIPRTGSYGAEKIWQGDEGITKPVMIFDLYRKTDFIDEKVPAALSIEVDKDNTKATWEKLETTDSKGNPYSFYVKESFKEEDVTNDNWVLGEDVDGQITNRLITGEEKKAQLTVGKELLEQFYNPGLLGGNTDRIKFNFILTGPYGYEEEFELYAGEEKVFSELYYGAYKLVEINSQGYEALLSQEEVVLTKEAPVNKISVENKHKIDEMNGMDLNVTEMQVTKLWVNGPQSDHKAVEMVLYRTTGGQEQEVMADVTIENVKDGFHYLWENLDKHSPEGYSYIYFVKEKGEIEGEFKVDDRVYETVYYESTIRNTFLIQKIEVKAEKLWVNAPKWTPSIWFKLLRKTEDGKFEEVPGADLLKVKSGQVIWKEVDKTDLLGNPYTFSVQEVDKEGKDYVPEDYKKEENGLKVTNTYTKTKDKLPSTGESSIGLLLFSGFAFLGSGSMLLRKKKK